MKKVSSISSVVRIKYLVLVLILPVLLSGCISFTSGDEQAAAGSLGGIFRSPDLGQNWQHVASLYTVGEQQNFGGANITALGFDTLDPKAIYVGTQANGVFYSYNYGTGWFNTLSDKKTINAIAVDQNDSCTIFAAAHNTVYKTTNCSREWKQVFFETRSGQYITALTTSKTNNVLYAGISDGAVLKSLDGGISWNVMRRFSSSIRNIFVQNSFNANVVYAVTKDHGVYRSADGGLAWEDMMTLPVYEAKNYEGEFTIFEKLENSRATIAANQDKSISDGIIYANRIGIFRLVDGQRWEQLKLLTPQGKNTILSIEVNPLNSDEIFYGTAVAVFHSIDNGANWEVRPLPTSYSAKFLSFSPDNKALYLGAFVIQ